MFLPVASLAVLSALSFGAIRSPLGRAAWSQSIYTFASDRKYRQTHGESCMSCPACHKHCATALAGSIVSMTDVYGSMNVFDVYYYYYYYYYYKCV